MASPERVLPLGASASAEEPTREDPAPPPTGGEEDDGVSVSSEQSRRAHSPGSGKPIYKVCQGCGKNNKLMQSDLHQECMECLGTDHLFDMLSCPACQALGLKDRLERARRFLYQRNERHFITA